MYLEYLQYLPIFLLPFGLSLIFTPVVRSLAIRYKLVAKPKQDRWHRRVTALLGGIGIYLSSIIGIVLFFKTERMIWGLLLGSSFIFAWGLSDDFKPMRPQMKLLGQIIASCIVILLGITFNIPKFQFFSYLLTFFWIIGITNSFNLLDNMDGLAAGIAVISGMMIFASSLLLNNDGIGVVGLILAAATLGFLPYNFNPAKIYMGDSGSMFLGFSLAVISIMSSYRHVSNFIITLSIPVLILGVPIFDTIFVMLMRKFGGRSFWQGGRDHTSHRIVSLGLPERRAVVLLYIISILFGLIALTYTKIDFIIVFILMLLTFIILFFFGIFLSDVQTYESKEDIEFARQKKLKQNKVVLNTVLLYKRIFLEVSFDLVLICISYYCAYLLKYESKIPEAAFLLIRESLPIMIVIRMVAFFKFGLYNRVREYISIPDLISIFKAVTISSLLGIVMLTLIFRFKDFSRVIFIIDWLILLFLVCGIRVILPILNEYFFSARTKGKRILIIGAGNTGEMVLREIKRSKTVNYHPVGFIDDDTEKAGKRIHGIPILGSREDVANLIKDYKIDELLITLPHNRKKEIIEFSTICEYCDIPYRKISGILDLKEEGDVDK
ncbi:MAG: hypothetical protein V1674_07590 [Candidatus Omnitrophota bacterium]